MAEDSRVRTVVLCSDYLSESKILLWLDCHCRYSWTPMKRQSIARTGTECTTLVISDSANGRTTFAGWKLFKLTLSKFWSYVIVVTDWLIVLCFISYTYRQWAPAVAQSVRGFASHAEGWVFESRPRQT